MIVSNGGSGFVTKRLSSTQNSPVLGLVTLRQSPADQACQSPRPCHICSAPNTEALDPVSVGIFLLTLSDNINKNLTLHEL